MATSPTASADQTGASLVAVSIGEQHGVALRDNGTVTTWGKAYRTPAALQDVIAVAAGSFHSLALRHDGSVEAWGHSGVGQAEPPDTLRGVTAIAAGRSHSLALRRDGTVVAWGSNKDGQSQVPYGLSDVVAIAAGAFHSLALRADGSVAAWGHSDSDQRQVPYGLVGAVSIAAGYETSSAIFADGSVVDWGIGTDFLRVPHDFSDVVEVVYGRRHRIALKRDGTVVADGSWMGGLTLPPDLPTIAALAGSITADHFSFVALDANGRLVVIKHSIVDAMSTGDPERGMPGLEYPALSIPPELNGNHATSSGSGAATQFGLNGISFAQSLDAPGNLLRLVAGGNETVVQASLDSGADVAAVDADGDGVLRYALGTGNLEILKLLLDRGADPNAPSTSASMRPDVRIIHAFSEGGWDDGVKMLVSRGAAIDATGVGGVTSLMLAAGIGSESTVSTLFALGADIDKVDDDGDSALFYAASNGQVATVRKLLDLGATPDARPGSSGYSALTIAAHAGSPVGRRPADIPASSFTNIVVALLRAGASPRPMYEMGLMLSQDGQIAPLSRVSRLVAGDPYWSITYVAPHARAQWTAPQQQQATPTTASRPTIPPTVSPPVSDRPVRPTGSRTPRATRMGWRRIDIVGSNQTEFVTNPTVKVIWNGRKIGTLKSFGGRFAFRIQSGGELRLKSGWRSTSVALTASRNTTVRLEWDRKWGKLVAITHAND